MDPMKTCSNQTRVKLQRDKGTHACCVRADNITVYWVKTPFHHRFCQLNTLTVMASSSEKCFLNFPGIFCENLKKKQKTFLGMTGVNCPTITNIVEKGGPYLPCLTKAADGCTVQTHYNGKKTVEVLLSFTAIKERKKEGKKGIHEVVRGHAVHWFTTGGSNIPI